MSEKTAYSIEELQIFEENIKAKITQAQQELDTTVKSLSDTNDNIAANTMATVTDKLLVEEQENLNLLAIRLKKFIQHLEGALERIKNNTYGICRKTGRLIAKERLLLVPHATLSVEAKTNRDKIM